jgi:hypothetical protein
VLICAGRKPGDRRRPLKALSRRVACLFRWRSDQKATFAWGDFIDARLPSPDGGQAKGAATIHVRLQIARPEPADAAIWIPQSCRAGGSLGRRERSVACTKTPPFLFLKIIESVCVSISAIWEQFPKHTRSDPSRVKASPREQKKNLRLRTNHAHIAFIGGRVKPRLRIGRCP